MKCHLKTDGWKVSFWKCQNETFQHFTFSSQPKPLAKYNLNSWAVSVDWDPNYSVHEAAHTKLFLQACVHTPRHASCHSGEGKQTLEQCPSPDKWHGKRKQNPRDLPWQQPSAALFWMLEGLPLQRRERGVLRPRVGRTGWSCLSHGTQCGAARHLAQPWTHSPVRKEDGKSVRRC